MIVVPAGPENLVGVWGSCHTYPFGGVSPDKDNINLPDHTLLFDMIVPEVCTEIIPKCVGENSIEIFLLSVNHHSGVPSNSEI